MPKIVVAPRLRGLICANAHPEGCAVNVRRQVEAAREAGPGAGLGNVLVIGSSTGYGLGVVIDDKLYVGATGTAGELGHTVVNPDGPLCSCGKRGCVMSYASGVAISVS